MQYDFDLTVDSEKWINSKEGKLTQRKKNKKSTDVVRNERADYRKELKKQFDNEKELQVEHYKNGIGHPMKRRKIKTPGVTKKMFKK